jgi:hypothetical protein
MRSFNVETFRKNREGLKHILWPTEFSEHKPRRQERLVLSKTPSRESREEADFLVIRLEQNRRRLELFANASGRLLMKASRVRR